VLGHGGQVFRWSGRGRWRIAKAQTPGPALPPAELVHFNRTTVILAGQGLGDGVCRMGGLWGVGGGVFGGVGVSDGFVGWF